MNTIEQAKAKAVSENPFYGCKALLTLQRFFEKVIDKNTNKSEVQQPVRAAWEEAKGNPEFIKLFFILIFAGGDVANREHNLFKGVKGVQQGGQAKRAAYRWAMEWVLNNPQTNAYFYKLLPLIAEYTNYENLFYNQLRTDRRKGTVLDYTRLPVDHGRIVLHLKSKIEDPATSEFELGVLAKFLPKVPKAKRWRKDKEGKTIVRAKKPQTLQKDAHTIELISALSGIMNWEVQQHPKNVRFIAYERFRSLYLKKTEAHLFSTREIVNFDKTGFLLFLEGLPAGARYRVQCRIVDKEGEVLKSNKRWKNTAGDDLGEIYLAWIKGKEEAKKKLLSLTKEDKDNMSKEEFKALTKQSKLTTGGETIYSTFIELYKTSNYGTLDISRSETNLKLQTLIDKVKVDVPVVTIIDVSGSMDSRINIEPGVTLSRLQFAKLIASVMMYKNPTPELSGMLMTFGTGCTIYYDGAVIKKAQDGSRWMATTSYKTVTLPTIADRTKMFSETFKTIDGLFQTEGVTNLQSVSQRLKEWTEEEPELKAQRIETIQQFPVWMIISDGDFNNASGGPASLLAFKRDMLQWFGADPVIVLWDIVPVSPGMNHPVERMATLFAGIDNFVHIAGFEPAVLNQVFQNLGNFDLIDIYTSLDAAYKSNRYEPIKTVLS
jgi:hypothetical protein